MSESSTARPLAPLVLVNGAPAAGKSTLARQIASALRLPLLSRDALKEAMAERTPFESLAENERFGLASVGVFYGVAGELLAAGVGAVLDNVFSRGVVEDDLRPLIARARAVQVHCAVPPEENRRRYVARFERGERHACHFDGERIARVLSGERRIDWSRFEPLELGIPTLRVDTWSGYAPDLERILQWVRESVAAPAAEAGPRYPTKQMGAGALFFNNAGELLLVKPTYRDHWSVPGGVVEADESPREACRREVREEIGLEVNIGRLLVVDYTTPRTGRGRESLQFLFSGGLLGAREIERITLPPAELSAFRFAPVAEAAAALNPRLACRLPAALAALSTRGGVYLEDGVDVSAAETR